MQGTSVSSDAGENFGKHEEIHNHQTQEVISIIVEGEEEEGGEKKNECHWNGSDLTWW